ncbi:MAG: PLP-dependent aminotransferase family protein, partial [Betaproteobacteria bacterium]|nr:PLP-dependent aminotransferase family protein [Betaproteobacteria bacterium]
MKTAQESNTHRIYELIRSRIGSGAMMAGEKLPSTRSSTVVVIYEQLAAEGYIETTAGARARVSSGLKSARIEQKPSDSKHARQAAGLSGYGQRLNQLSLPQPPMADPRHINFLYGAIADEDFPTLTWRRLYNRMLTRHQQHLYYRAREGE